MSFRENTGMSMKISLFFFQHKHIPRSHRVKCSISHIGGNGILVNETESLKKITMEKARENLGITEEELEAVSQLTVRPRQAGSGPSFYEVFALRGILVDRVEPGFVACTYKVPPRLTDASGKLSSGAIAGLVDEVGAAAIHIEGLPMEVSVDMSISYLSAARANDELEITSKALGRKGGYFGTIVQLKNKATGEVVAEGRHSLYGKARSKI
ncbi:hypothetical protein NE237_010393 [Protea cynaroides]|uniref:Acyl-coenzyme A thioesterase 13 n=1 Tax=Protea cynaroides TaxID=273540 RepID=A0A9Q0KZ80_9MAGN|nr:hypothetical protein NE237_010393 [Protea cynaroides]